MYFLYNVEQKQSIIESNIVVAKWWRRFLKINVFFLGFAVISLVRLM